MNSVGDGRKRSTLKSGSPLQRVRRVSLDLASGGGLKGMTVAGEH
jgi:hypothetical protein